MNNMRQALPVNGDEVCMNYFFCNLKIFVKKKKRKYGNISDFGSVVRDVSCDVI